MLDLVFASGRENGRRVRWRRPTRVPTRGKASMALDRLAHARNHLPGRHGPWSDAAGRAPAPKQVEASRVPGSRCAQALGARLGCHRRRGARTRAGTELRRCCQARRLAGLGSAHEQDLRKAPDRCRRSPSSEPHDSLLKSTSLDEKLELLRRLQRGKLADTPAGLPIVEVVPRAT
jgi:hypothetical protein